MAVVPPITVEATTPPKTGGFSAAKRRRGIDHGRTQFSNPTKSSIGGSREEEGPSRAVHKMKPWTKTTITAGVGETAGFGRCRVRSRVQPRTEGFSRHRAILIASTGRRTASADDMSVLKCSVTVSRIAPRVAASPAIS